MHVVKGGGTESILVILISIKTPSKGFFKKWMEDKLIKEKYECSCSCGLDEHTT